jgi:carboxyl-terminal processing protease
MSMKRSIWVGVALVLSCWRCVADESGGSALPVASNAPVARESAVEQMEALAEAMLLVKRYYVQEKSYTDIVNGALHGMLANLDSHSGFIDASEMGAVQEELGGRFVGVGATIGIKEGRLTVVAPIEDSPGHRAGLMAGDWISAIDGATTERLPIPEAVKRLRGEKGSKVTLTINRRQEDQPHDVTIVRDEIRVPSVKGARLIRDGIGYIRIVQFSEPTAPMLQKAVEKLTSEGMTALVLDLRNNPGGVLTSATAVAGMFLKPGQLVVTTKGRGNEGVSQLRAARGYHWTKGPVAILVNGGSASASEIVAGALQDHGRAVLVGETTFGKGSVQSVIRMGGQAGAALRLTTAYYYTPAGRLIHEKGIDPDVRVVVPPAEWRNIQMQRARIETPELVSESERSREGTAVDAPLERALDMLHAIRLYRAERSR